MEQRKEKHRGGEEEHRLYEKKRMAFTKLYNKKHLDIGAFP